MPPKSRLRAFIAKNARKRPPPDTTNMPREIIPRYCAACRGRHSPHLEGCPNLNVATAYRMTPAPRRAAVAVPNNGQVDASATERPTGADRDAQQNTCPVEAPATPMPLSPPATPATPSTRVRTASPAATGSLASGRRTKKTKVHVPIVLAPAPDIRALHQMVAEGLARQAPAPPLQEQVPYYQPAYRPLPQLTYVPSNVAAAAPPGMSVPVHMGMPGAVHWQLQPLASSPPLPQPSRPRSTRPARRFRSRSILVNHASDCPERIEREKRTAIGVPLSGLNGSKCGPNCPRRLAIALKTRA